ncbi:hypothetical protein B0H19DRAFT_1195027 [Mycena capillaripes]|nr:hypothetical protein B0H19DRAFT_1195027 [Mycena capillaripes]
MQAPWQSRCRPDLLHPWVIPGSFDRPPRNPAEKINSGYKAWERLLYVYGAGPALLYGNIDRIRDSLPTHPLEERLRDHRARLVRAHVAPGANRPK